MTPLPVIANTYRVAQQWRDEASGQTAVNVMHVRGTGTTATAIAAAWSDFLVLDQWFTATTSSSIQAVTVTPLDGSGASVTHDVGGPNNVGSQSGDFAPAVACVVGLKTTLRGRSHRGRVYVPFTGDGAIDNGILAVGVNTVIEGAWGTFMGNLVTAGLALVVASYKLSTATDVATIEVLSGLGTQRRRQTRVRYP